MRIFVYRMAPALLAALTLTSTALATQFEVDPAHSTIGFSVKHMMISTVNGHFNDYKGEFDFDPKTGKLGNSKFEAKAASIDTGNPKRDEHLRSPDFFDVAKYPTLSITNSKIKKTGEGKYEWDADLTMHGVTKPVKFALEFGGETKGMDGAQHIGLTATTTIKRADWGLKWNKAIEAGGVAVSDDVKLNLEVEAGAKK